MAMNMRNFIAGFLLTGISINASAQLKPIGSWTDHLPLIKGTSITSDGINIYAGTETGFFTYNTNDNSISKFTKVSLLNDVSISKIAYSDTAKSLIVVYDNANIDIIQSNTVTNIPFIKLSRENKTVNNIKIIGNLAYLSMEYGITVVNLAKKEIVDTYKFGPNGAEINVNATDIFNGEIYAGTDAGIYKADITRNLLDFNSWSRIPQKSNQLIHAIWENNNALQFAYTSSTSKDSVLTYDGSTFSNLDAIGDFTFIDLSETTNNQFNLTTSTDLFIFDSSQEVIATFSKNNSSIKGTALTDDGRLFQINGFTPLIEMSVTDGSGTSINFFRPNGPVNGDVFDMDIADGKLWLTQGAINGAYNNQFDLAKLSYFDGDRWNSFRHIGGGNTGVGLNDIFDLVSVTSNPNNPDQVFFGSWGRGLVEYNGGAPFKVYQDTNSLYTNNFGQTVSALQTRLGWNGFWLGTGETVFDEDGNLWGTNTYQKNGLFVRLADGSWFSYNLGDLYSSDETAMYDIEIDDNGYKWISMPKDNDIIVYDDNSTIKDISDDRSIRLTRAEGLGTIPGARGIKIEKDKDGLIWIGTSDGIAVHFNPSAVFDGDINFDRVIFFDGENNEIVLQNSIVTEIAIDGFNRKWIGTENSGVILLSEDGKETILEFNEDNSPLLSNSISAITIDEETGEVYIATSKGLVSYRAEAVQGEENFSSVSVYPNPVRPEYNGNIAISGLIDNSTIKITDINGYLINELKSQGGQVLWDGNNFEGRRASTGVYLVFVSANDENQKLQTEVGKIMFVR